MSGTEVSLTTLLEQVIALALQSMDGPVVGKVNGYNSAKNRANVTPLVPLLVAGEWEPTPTLPEVPVAWPGGPSHSYKFPIVGGLVQLAPLGHDHSDWTVTGAAGIPAKSERRFSLADLVAYPLAPSPLATPPDPLSFDTVFAVLFGKHTMGADATDFAAMAAKVLSEDQSIANWADAHTHDAGGYTNTAGPVTGISGTPVTAPAVPDPVPAPGSTACTRLKVK